MKASELYNQSVAQVDALQKSIHNHVRDQLGLCQDLQQHQDRMKRLQAIIQTDGDRELTGQEVVTFLGTHAAASSRQPVTSNPHETYQDLEPSYPHLQNSNNVVR